MRGLALLAIALPALAAAQPAPRSAEPNATALHRIAACLVRRDTRRSSAFLTTAPTDSQARLLTDMGAALDECAAEAGGEGQQLRLSAASLRGPVAEAFLERDFSGWTPRSGRRPVAIYALTPPPAQVPRTRLLADMASCVAEAQPAGVLALMATEPASTAEERATAALVPALGPCFRNGQTADVTRTQLRGLLAEAAYRRAVALVAARPTSG